MYRGRALHGLLLCMFAEFWLISLLQIHHMPPKGHSTLEGAHPGPNFDVRYFLLLQSPRTTRRMTDRKCAVSRPPQLDPPTSGSRWPSRVVVGYKCDGSQITVRTFPFSSPQHPDQESALFHPKSTPSSLWQLLDVASMPKFASRARHQGPSHRTLLLPSFGNTLNSLLAYDSSAHGNDHDASYLATDWDEWVRIPYHNEHAYSHSVQVQCSSRKCWTVVLIHREQ